MRGSIRSSIGIDEYVSDYLALCKAFEEGLSSLTECIAKHSERLNIDGNLGLARQLPRAYQYHAVRQLQRIYLTLHLDDLVAAAGIEESNKSQQTQHAAAIALLYEMVEKGFLKQVQIDVSKAIVRFNNSSLEPEFPQRLRQQTEKLHDLLKAHCKLDNEIAQSNAYSEELARKYGIHMTSAEKKKDLWDPN